MTRSALEAVVAAYDRENPMRTADCHPVPCDCLRCAIDAAKGELKSGAPFSLAELEHLHALVSGGGYSGRPGGKFTAEGVIALKAKLGGMVDGPE